MTQMDELQVQRLLDKFMAGETTVEEERALTLHFQKAKHVKAEWADYKSMFEYFAEGMPLSDGMPALHDGSDTPRRPRRAIMRIVVGAMSAAAAVALIFALALPRHTGGKAYLAEKDEPRQEQPAKASHNKAEKAQTTAEEDAGSGKPEKKAEPAPVNKAKKRAKRLQYGIPAPVEYIAHNATSDTTNIVDRELIDNYLSQCATMDLAMDEMYQEEMDEEQADVINE